MQRIKKPRQVCAAAAWVFEKDKKNHRRGAPVVSSPYGNRREADQQAHPCSTDPAWTGDRKMTSADMGYLLSIQDMLEYNTAFGAASSGSSGFRISSDNQNKWGTAALYLDKDISLLIPLITRGITTAARAGL